MEKENRIIFISFPFYFLPFSILSLKGKKAALLEPLFVIQNLTFLWLNQPQEICMQVKKS